MSAGKRKCQYFNCDATYGVQLYNVIHDVYFNLCVGHARMLVSARKSNVALIEFLVDCYGGKEPLYRAQVRRFIMDETKRILDG